MQNLPIQFTQTPPVKNGSADAVSKIEPVSPASNQSFQNMLSKQVQIKQAGTNLANPNQTKPKQAAAPAGAQAPANMPPKLNQSNNGVAADKSRADSKAAQQSGTEDDTQSVADSAGIKRRIASDADALSAQALAKEKDTDADAKGVASTAVDPALAGQLLMPAIPVVNAVADAQTGVDATSQKAALSLDAALNKALSQGKNAAADGAGKLEDDASPDMANARDNSKVSVDNTRWLDSVMANAAKSSTSDDLANARLAASSAKDIVVKDIAALPAYQPVAMANSVQAAQQIAGANVINATPGKAGWDEAISQKVVWMVGAGEQSASLTLNPPDMGPLQVIIHVHNDQADTTFISDNPEVRQALENGLSTLREKMSEAGIQLGQANVNSGGQAQQEFQRASQERMAGRASLAGEGNQADLGDAISNSSSIVRVANGLVDTFA